MGTYRTYFTKDNTIIKNKTTNTGLNPILELVHGNSAKVYSRVIFSFGVDEIKDKIEDKTIINNVKHTLNLTNTIGYDRDVLNQLTEITQDHASSFDLVLFKVPEFWDEGTGYDFDYNQTLLDIGGKIYSSPSNWIERTGSNNWSEAGIYSGSTSSYYQPISTIHFDLGNENIKVDITELVEELIENGTDDFYGLGLAFTNIIENQSTEKLYTVDFYGKDTHTFFEPFVETTWDDIVEDDRANFCYDNINKLYLYTNVNREPTNLDELPTSVTIVDFNGDDAMILNNIVQEGKGIYSVEFELSSEDYQNINMVNFSDIWDGLKMNNRLLPAVEMEFTLKHLNIFNIGNETFEPQEFVINFTGIRKGEKIEKGDIRKIIVTAKEFYLNDVLILDNIYYTLYVKQGNSKVVVIPETKINRAFNQNYFYLDTSWLITQDYFMDIIVHSNGTITKKGDINFTIIDGKTDNLTGNIQVL